MRGLKKDFIFLFYVASGIIIGALIADVCRNIKPLQWLAYGDTIGISANNPAIIDLLALKMNFSFALSITVAQIITIALALWLYNRNR